MKESRYPLVTHLLRGGEGIFYSDCAIPWLCSQGLQDQCRAIGFAKTVNTLRRIVRI